MLKIQGFGSVSNNSFARRNNNINSQTNFLVNDNSLKNDTVSFGASFPKKVLKLGKGKATRIKAALETRIRQKEILSPPEIKLLREVRKICGS